MTALPTPDVLAALNIDTAEKAFLYSTFALRRTNLSPGSAGKFYNSVRIAENIQKQPLADGTTVINSTLTVYLSIPYDSMVFLENGGDIGKALRDFGIDSVNTDGLPVCDPGGGIALDPLPSTVVTLEQYNLAAARQIQKYLLQLPTPDVDTMKIKFLEEATQVSINGVSQYEARMQIDAFIPYDLQKYITTNSYICAAKSLVAV